MRNEEKEAHLASVERALLEAGGVEAWAWYHDSLNDSGVDENSTDADWLSAIEAGGVDNWDWYSESLGEFSLYSDYVLESETPLSELKSYGDWLEAHEAELLKAKEAEEIKATKARELQIVQAEEKKREEAARDGGYLALVKATEAVVDPDDAQTVAKKLVEAGFWKRSTAANEMAKAIRTAEVGRVMESARENYVKIVAAKDKGKFFRKLVAAQREG